MPWPPRCCSRLMEKSNHRPLGIFLSATMNASKSNSLERDTAVVRETARTIRSKRFEVEDFIEEIHVQGAGVGSAGFSTMIETRRLKARLGGALHRSRDSFS